MPYANLERTRFDITVAEFLDNFNASVKAPNTDLQEFLNEEIPNGEILQAVDKLKSGKSPGPDDDVTNFSDSPGGLQRFPTKLKSFCMKWKLSDTYQSRLDHYRKECQRLTEKSGKHQAITNRILYEDKHKLIYCAVPKVANSNWRKVLLVLLGVLNNTENVHPTLVHGRYQNRIQFLTKLQIMERTRRLETYFKFIFVRHPFERILSAFRDKFESTASWDLYFPKTYGPQIIQRYRTGSNRTLNTSQMNIQFREFIQFIIDSGPRTSAFDHHWRPIYQLCSVCDIAYDLIGKFENLDKEALYVLKRAGVNGNVSFPHSDVHSTNTSNADILHRYYSTIPENNMRRLYELYQPDFELFGYPFPEKFMQWSKSP
ncbi:carbohydrate sulfotransferase 11-like [Glandiceps talaboti]